MRSQPKWCSLEALQWISSDKEKAILDQLYSLLTIESLTQGLEMIDSQFEVEVLSCAQTSQYDSEMTPNPIRLCRKVALKLSKLAVVYAESHCDLDAIEARSFLECGSNSLGRRLFSQTEKLQRSEFTYAFFTFNCLPSALQLMLEKSEDILCARRSYFIIDGQRLAITEWYLPALNQKLANVSQK